MSHLLPSCKIYKSDSQPYAVDAGCATACVQFHAPSVSSGDDPMRWTGQDLIKLWTFAAEGRCDFGFWAFQAWPVPCKHVQGLQ